MKKCIRPLTPPATPPKKPAASKSNMNDDKKINKNEKDYENK